MRDIEVIRAGGCKEDGERRKGVVERDKSE